MAKKVKISLTFPLDEQHDPHMLFQSAKVAIGNNIYAEESGWEIYHDDTSMIKHINDSAIKLNEYQERLISIEKNMNMIYANYADKEEYINEINTLKTNKSPSKHDYEKVNKLNDVSKYAGEITYMHKYLYELPEEKEYEKLNFLQKLVHENMRLDRIIKNPSNITGAVKRSFDEYQKHYIDIYVKKDMLIRKEINDIWDTFSKLEKKINTISYLDQIKILGPKHGDALSSQYLSIKQRFEKCHKCKKDEKNVISLIQASSKCDKYKIGNDMPGQIISNIISEVNTVLAKKFEMIQVGATRKILSSSKKSSVQKLISLSSISQIEQMSELFHRDTADILIHEMQKLLSSSELDSLQLGDFLSKEEGVTEKNKSVIINEFETFINKKLKDTKTILLK